LPFDRCSAEDRRKTYRLGYFMEGGVERRSGIDRRSMDQGKSIDRRAVAFTSSFDLAGE
jgi:hypothetical protein